MGSLPPVIAIDGPSGSGKGTLSQRLATFLGWHFLDSGAMYRVLGLAASNRGIDLADEPGVTRVAENLDVRFGASGDGGASEIWLDGVEVSAQIRTEQGGAAAPAPAAEPAAAAPAAAAPAEADAAAPATAAADSGKGKTTYDAVCFVCHTPGAAGASVSML